MRGCAPEQRLAVFIVLAHELIDLAQQLFDAAEGAAASGFVGDQSEGALHLIEPGTIIGRLWRPPRCWAPHRRGRRYFLLSSAAGLSRPRTTMAARAAQ